MSDVEIWFAQNKELYRSLRNNGEIGRSLSCRKIAPSEIDFFNRISQKLTFKCVYQNGGDSVRDWRVICEGRREGIHLLRLCALRERVS